jgi:hypothetical protein
MTTRFFPSFLDDGLRADWDTKTEEEHYRIIREHDTQKQFDHYTKSVRDAASGSTNNRHLYNKTYELVNTEVIRERYLNGGTFQAESGRNMPTNHGYYKNGEMFYVFSKRKFTGGRQEVYGDIFREERWKNRKDFRDFLIALGIQSTALKPYDRMTENDGREIRRLALQEIRPGRIVEFPDGEKFKIMEYGVTHLLNTGMLEQIGVVNGVSSKVRPNRITLSRDEFLAAIGAVHPFVLQDIAKLYRKSDGSQIELPVNAMTQFIQKRNRSKKNTRKSRNSRRQKSRKIRRL